MQSSCGWGAPFQSSEAISRTGTGGGPRRQQDDQQLDDDIAASAELGAARSHYRQCAQAAGGIVASDPGDARAVALVDSAKAKAVAAVLADCEAGWATGYDRAASTVAERFAEGHADELSAIKRHYDTALSDISHDDGFLTYLSEQAALAES